MKSNDLEFYYFMRYGKIPQRFINPDAVVKSDTCEFRQRKPIGLLKSCVSGSALLFWFILFLYLFFYAIQVDPGFVEDQNNIYQFTANLTKS